MVVSVNEMLPLHRFEVVVTSVADVNDSASLSFSYDLIGKLFEDAIVTLCVGIRKSTLGSVLTKSKVIPKVQPGSGTVAGVSPGFRARTLWYSAAEEVYLHNTFLNYFYAHT